MVRLGLALLRQKTAVAEFRAEKRSSAEPREARWGPGHVPGVGKTSAPAPRSGVRSTSKRSFDAAALGTLSGALGVMTILTLSRAAAADQTNFEVGPWLGWAAGSARKTLRVPTPFGVFEKQTETAATSVNAGLDVTTAVTFFGGGYGGPWEIRLGPWGAFEIPGDRGAFGEGGLTLVLTEQRHASFGTYGIRIGGGYGGDREPSFSVTLFGGVRYVPARSGREGSGPAGVIENATGLRLVLTARRFFERQVRVPFGEQETGVILFGVEFEPSFLLPPYAPEKWGGAH